MMTSQAYATKWLKMQTKDLGFVGLDYLMMETKWKLTQAPYKVNSKKCLQEGKYLTKLWSTRKLRLNYFE